MNNSPESQHTKEIKGKLFLLKPRWQTWSLPTPSVTSYSNPHKISPWNPWSLFQKYWLTQPWWQFFNTLLFSYFIDEFSETQRDLVSWQEMSQAQKPALLIPASPVLLLPCQATIWLEEKRLWLWSCPCDPHERGKGWGKEGWNAWDSGENQTVGLWPDQEEE